ncbi:DNA helicase [Tanacetum coccineum]
MATTSNINKAREDKSKMIIAEPEITNIVDLRPIHSNKIIEAIVCKWTYKHIHTRQPTKYSCMLIDEQGAPIQENIDVKDADYFDQLLQLHKANKILGFSCEQTDYADRIQAVSRIYTSGDVTTNQTHRRIIDIQNLSGNIIGLTLWHEMALNFNVQEYESLEKPVVIAVSSCWSNGLMLSGTSATHWYLQSKSKHTRNLPNQIVVNTKPILTIDNQRYEDSKQEIETGFLYLHYLKSIHKTISTLLSLPAPPPQKHTPTTASEEQPEQIQTPNPSSPTLSTTTSNQPDIVDVGFDNLQPWLLVRITSITKKNTHHSKYRST